MPVILSDADIAELNRLLARFRIEAMAEVRPLGDFLNAKINAQRQQDAIAAKVAQDIAAEAQKPSEPLPEGKPEPKLVKKKVNGKAASEAKAADPPQP